LEVYALHRLVQAVCIGPAVQLISEVLDSGLDRATAGHETSALARFRFWRPVVTTGSQLLEHNIRPVVQVAIAFHGRLLHEITIHSIIMQQLIGVWLFDLR